MPIYFDLMDPSLPLAPESIGNRWEQENILRPNGYPFYHWMQTEEGQGTLRIEDAEIPLPRRAGILIAPFMPHAYFRSGKQWVTSFATFAGKLEPDIHKIVGPKPYIVVDAAEGEFYHAWVGQTVQDHEHRRLHGIRLSCECYAFLLRLGCSQGESETADHPLYRRYVMPAIREIETHHDQPVTAEGLAAALYVSPQYLSRLFKRFAGCSVYAYLTAHRMGRAKSLLVNHPGMEVQEIAYRVGYLDPSHFIALFKQKTGYTPLAFRKLHIG